MSDEQPQIFDSADIPQVALASMNETHREEVELVNRLARLIRMGQSDAADDAEISQQIQHWLDHTLAHFERENALMETYGFPAYPMHKGEHDRILALLGELQETWRDHHQLEPMVRFLFKTWPEWFDNHVNTMDRITAQFVCQQGGG